MKKFFNRVPVGVFSVIATAIIVYLLLMPPDATSSKFYSWLHFKNSDKLIHFLMFFFLNFVYLYDYTKFKNPRHTKINKELAFTAVAAMVGLLSESAQLAMGLGREYDNLDLVADVLGALVAFGLMRWFGSHVLRKYLFYMPSSRHNHRHHRSSKSS